MTSRGGMTHLFQIFVAYNGENHKIFLKGGYGPVASPLATPLLGDNLQVDDTVLTLQSLM